METEYVSTFTPLGEDEKPKKCPKCDKILSASSFRKRIGSRDGQEGIIRNFKCRQCEGKVTEEKVRKRALEEDQKYSLIKDDFDKKANILTSKLENIVGVIKRMDRQIKQLLDENERLKERLSNLDKENIEDDLFNI